MKRILFILASLILSCPLSHAELSLRLPTADHMVLQQQASAAVWGYATPGSTITVVPSWSVKKYTCKTGSDGLWKAMVYTPEASYTPYTIEITGDGGAIIVKDVLVGEVWLACGQSNMEMPVRGFTNCPVEGYNEILTSAPGRDKVRMLYAYADQSDEPLVELRNTTLWQGADAEGVAEMSATAYFFAKKLNQVLDVPVGIVEFARGGSRVESWLPKETVAAFGEDVSPEAVEARTFYTRPFQMYNAMEYPVRGYTAKGFIWYQGCSNVGAADVFQERMTEMVRLFRSDWGDKDCRMPFYQVEIAPYLYDESGAGTAGAELRQAQRITAEALKNSAIICTNDLVKDYESRQIHPTMKEPVGNRLAYLALNRDYGFKKIACESPLALEAQVRDGVLRIKMKNCRNGVDRLTGVKTLEIIAADGGVYPVTDISCDYGMIMISLDGIESPKYVTYGWGDFKPGNLHNCEGLPVFPFKLEIE